MSRTDAYPVEQLGVFIPADKRVDTPLLVVDENGLPVGVLWAGGRGEKGNTFGIVTPIKLWKP